MLEAAESFFASHALKIDILREFGRFFCGLHNCGTVILDAHSRQIVK